jgi:hypothetical protein
MERFDFINTPAAKKENPESSLDIHLDTEFVHREGLEDIDEAREFIAECLKNNINPIITIPEEFADEVMKYGIHFIPKQDVKTGRKFSFIAGTIGIGPYLPEGQSRYIMEIDPKNIQIEPRITGKQKRFYGVVGFVGGVPAESFKPLGKFSQKEWDEYKKRTLN